MKERIESGIKHFDWSGTMVMEFNSAGGCIELGKLIRETAKFYVYEERQGFTDPERGPMTRIRERKVKRRDDAQGIWSAAHLYGCHSCGAGYHD